MSTLAEQVGFCSPFSDNVGCRLVAVGEHSAHVDLQVDEHLRNRHGLLHGGALFTLMDVTMGLACSSAHGFDRNSVTLEAKINYVRPVRDGVVKCRATVLHAGRSTLVVEATLTQGEKLVAKGQGTFAQL